MFRHILVPVGLGTGSLAAARYALGLSRWLGCKVTFLHVLEHPNPPIAEALAKMLQGVRHPPKVLLVEPHSQSIAAVVAQTAQKNHVDLIVIGRHDTAQQAPEELGLVARSILASAQVPVQVVPDVRLLQSRPWLQRLAEGGSRFDGKFARTVFLTKRGSSGCPYEQTLSRAQRMGWFCAVLDGGQAIEKCEKSVNFSSCAESCFWEFSTSTWPPCSGAVPLCW